MLPEEKARVKIDDKLNRAGWYVVNRDEYVPKTTSAIREALAQGNKERRFCSRIFFQEKMSIQKSTLCTLQKRCCV